MHLQKSLIEFTSFLLQKQKFGRQYINSAFIGSLKCVEILKKVCIPPKDLFLIAGTGTA